MRTSRSEVPEGISISWQANKNCTNKTGVILIPTTTDAAHDNTFIVKVAFSSLPPMMGPFTVE